MFSSNSSQVSQDAVFIEDIFSTYLYTGNGSTQTITNGIDLSTKGGLVWLKNRGAAASNALFDTQRGVNKLLISNSTNAEFTGSSAYGVTAFNSNGFSFQVANPSWNDNTNTYASWTFRKQAKFFDIVTYTGTGSAQNIAHSLGSAPGAIFIKRTDSTASWGVYHRSLQTTPGLENKGIVYLDLTNSVAYGTSPWNDTAPTSTQFTVGYAAETNASGGTYVAYLFAHNAGGFGLTGTDSVISCGSFTTSNGVSGLVNVGFEPQWVLIKRTDSSTLGDWQIYDNMRGIVATNNGGTYQQSSQYLKPNLSSAEGTDGYGLGIYQQGFNFNDASGTSTYIYIAIRRGPMKTPTTASTVFDVVQQNAGQFVTTNNVVDMLIETYNLSTYNYPAVFPRLTQNYTETNSTAAESVGGPYIGFDYNTGIKDNYVGSGLTALYYLFQRAPSFMDVVCYTGTGANTSFSHNLTVAPEMMIFKRRSSSGSWLTYHKDVGNDYYLSVDSTAAKTYSPTTFLNSTSPTASVYTVGIATSINFSGSTYVAYLFASCPGVSKVGSYSGTGATQTISCGFAARFVLIKRTDSTGSWWVWDTARGMVAGTDPRLALNSTAAETNADWVYTNASGFQIVTTDASVNASGGSYIYLAIA